MKLIDIPRYVPIEDYENLKIKLINHLTQYKEIISIYQLGSIKNPGISDLDILCVFKENNSKISYKELNLTSNEKYILTHSLFGIHEKNYHLFKKFIYQSNYVLLSGERIITKNFELSNDIKRQIALEYLLIFFISLSRQLINDTVKLRTFLLEAKAIEFDLELLNIKNTKLNHLVEEIIKLRNDYFQVKVNNHLIIKLIKQFHQALEEVLGDELKKQAIFSPYNQFKIAKNITIENGSEIKIIKKGIFLPTFFNFIGKYYSKLNHKIGKIIVKVPMQIPSQNSAISSRFELIKELQEFQNYHFPDFIPLTSKLNFFR